MFNLLSPKKLFSLIITLVMTVAFFTFFKPDLAQAGGACQYAGQCASNVTCIWIPDPGIVPEGGYLSPSGGECGSAVIGGITAPDAITRINSTSGIGLLVFFSRVLSFLAIVGGIIVVGNFVSAGLMYITGAGNTDTHIKVRDKITYSVLGIIIIVSAYTIVGLMGLIFFKDVTFLLNPRLQGVL